VIVGERIRVDGAAVDEDPRGGARDVAVALRNVLERGDDRLAARRERKHPGDALIAGKAVDVVRQDRARHVAHVAIVEIVLRGAIVELLLQGGKIAVLRVAHRGSAAATDNDHEAEKKTLAAKDHRGECTAAWRPGSNHS
jgi:hypothetical protein